MDGLIIVDKPAGPTSHDIVQRVRRLLGLQRVGHAGTLDPGATGVLLVMIGQGTRFFPFLSGHDKSYEGTIRLGHSTDTYDSSGRRTSPESEALPGPEAIARAMKALEGEFPQTPPPYSAKKVGGTPGYKLARADKPFSLSPVRVRVRIFEATVFRPPFVDFRTACSTGTYVRSLAHDLGRALGCGARLETLRRTSVGPFRIERAVTMERLEEAVGGGGIASLVLPLAELLPDVPAVTVLPEAVPRVSHGAPLGPSHLAEGFAEPPTTPPGPVIHRLIDADGRLLALARRVPGEGRLRPFLVIR